MKSTMTYTEPIPSVRYIGSIENILLPSAVVYNFLCQFEIVAASWGMHVSPAKHSFAWLPRTRAPRGTDRSPEYNEHFCYKLDSRVKNLTTEWNQKQQHFITHASRSLLWIRFVAVAFRSEEKVFWRRGPPPVDLFCLALVPPLGKYGQNIFMHVPGHEHFIPTKFRKHPLSGSVVKAGYVFPYIHMH